MKGLTVGRSILGHLSFVNCSLKGRFCISELYVSLRRSFSREGYLQKTSAALSRGCILCPVCSHVLFCICHQCCDARVFWGFRLVSWFAVESLGAWSALFFLRKRAYNSQFWGVLLGLLLCCNLFEARLNSCPEVFVPFGPLSVANRVSANMRPSLYSLFVFVSLVAFFLVGTPWCSFFFVFCVLGLVSSFVLAISPLPALAFELGISLG